MTPSKTPFAALERLAAGDPLSSDGYAFQDIDRAVIDRLLNVGAVTHKHDAHAALANPTVAPTIAFASSGGTIRGGTPVFVAYTLLDVDGGETLAAPHTTLTAPAGYLTPTDAPVAAVDYLAGTLLAANYSYAVTVTDGAGGETAVGPAAVAVVDPGHANAEAHLSGLTAATNAASGSDPLAGWRLWRRQGGGPWYLIATGPYTADTFTDNGVAGDCTIQPPAVGTTHGANSLQVTVPGGLPAGTVQFNIYASIDGSFTSPALLANYPVSQAGVMKTFTTLEVVQSGAPPAVSRAFPGANKINPDTDIVNWYWKAPVANFASLPSVGNNDGDVRVTLDTHSLFEWNAATSTWVAWDPAGTPPTTVGSSQETGDYTLAAVDQSTVVEFTGAALQHCTIPPHSAVPFPVGTVIEVFQDGAGQVIIVAGVGVTLRSFGGLVHTAGQYASIGLRQRALNEWVLTGNLA